jgi:hypothetical protein
MVVLSNILQTAMVFVAFAMQYFKGSRDKGPFALGAIALLAFSSGAQVAMARAMQMLQITTALATVA